MADGVPKLMQKMTMHLNGSGFSELHYRIYVDGEPTNIMRYKRTGGSPKYMIIADVMGCGEDRFDVRETRGVGMQEWLLAHIPTVLEQSP